MMQILDLLGIYFDAAVVFVVMIFWDENLLRFFTEKIIVWDQ